MAMDVKQYHVCITMRLKFYYYFNLNEIMVSMIDRGNVLPQSHSIFMYFFHAAVWTNFSLFIFVWEGARAIRVCIEHG